MAQLPLTSASENWKPRFTSMSQKSKIVFNFFLMKVTNALATCKGTALILANSDDFCLKMGKILHLWSVGMYYLYKSMAHSFQ